ncbi:MAG: class I SAM-dependent RNA methyltransferase [Lachnospiraceae bacterium]|nr:class I SAM-dependent RNA methyltransferase [Lachnospiraceae bacterium]
MKKGMEKIGKVLRTDYPNKGIVMTDEGPVKVACALPGQTVRITIKKVRNGNAEGILREVVENADIETDPACPHAGRCGGCLYQTYPYEEEVRIKEGQVRRLIEPVLECQESPYEFEGILGSPVHEGYRNKMEFSFGDSYKDGPLALGMHVRRSMYDIETVTGCCIADPDYGKIIECTLDIFGSRHVPYYHRNTHVGYLRHLLVRRTRTGEILIGLVTSGQSELVPGTMTSAVNDAAPDGEEALLSLYKDELLRLEADSVLSGNIRGILHIVNDSVSDAVKADRIDILYGEEYITEKLCGLEFKISTFSFFQTNTYGAEVLYGKVREYAESLGDLGDGAIYDLYSGTGTITQIMAEDTSAECVGVEIVEEAVEAAKENALRNGLSNCRFIAGDVLKVLDDLTDKPALIILDPPREGIHPKAMPKILSYGVEHIIYVSCKTTSLVNDLQAFLEAGYEVRKLCPVDQFPRTGNIEVVVSLGKNFAKPKDYVQIGIDAENYYRIKDNK